MMKQDSDNPKKDSEKSLSKPKQQTKDSDITDPELIEDLPNPIKEVIEKTSMMMYSGRMPSPIAKKITKEHITDLISAASKEDERRFSFAKQGRLLAFISFLILVMLFVFLVIYLSDSNPQLLVEIIKGTLLVTAGFGGGYGYCKSRQSD